ncbi:16S rRNA (guanine(966)-N(2))-methyltransferase RsmD [Thalassomonas sp. M1454]|uniref:16S rRNA (guanine(966)-N(2))-methyltransferase RsmD n=1 Tax=Thalassomonas sp. M1454 TaxID=2594477 RepID=UPI00117EAE1C|nr:16S rRNA (guanine(966)-N(2))-methyltransferase RsmD [Thalassomonas sp. M1454]TRX58029.1 16S rRNA (guanine(966)-N(2))-methyltransferase RsmD [Thalassomonas sp. M1454]
MARNNSNRNKSVKAASNNKAGSVRIIAGQYRGRKLPVIMAEGLRPTTDRVKETVFNWLMPYLYEAKCLDCFAGSGSLGFEALSRGASRVEFFELNKSASTQISNNIKLLKTDEASVTTGSCLQLLPQKTNAQYDLVFIDPPFRQGLVKATAQLLEQENTLAKDAVIYLEVEAELSQLELPSNWQLLKEKVAGQVAYRLYQRN